MLKTTGPTGSGKTTTMYALMRMVDAIHTSVQTVENPVEIRVGVWRQHQLNRDGNEHIEWANWNKGLLRSDPDVVLQGEVRNADLMHQVADMSNTGHLVFTTFHASNSALAVARLREMRTSAGEALDMDMIAELMHGILAQQLARLLCTHCSIPDNSEDTTEKMKLVSAFENYDGHEITPYKAGKGCDHCYGSGYRGRKLVYEILKFNRQVKDMVIGKASLHDLRNMIPREKQMSGRLLQMVSKGVTSMEEAYRIAEDL